MKTYYTILVLCCIFFFSFFDVFSQSSGKTQMACVTTPLTFSSAACGTFAGTSYTNQGGANNGTAPSATCGWGTASAGSSTWISFTYEGPPSMAYLIGDQAPGGAGNNPAIAIYSADGCTLKGCDNDNAAPAAGEGNGIGKVDMTTLGLTVGQTYLARIYNEGNTANVKAPTLMCSPASPCGDCYTSPCVISNINTNFSSSTWGSHASDCCTWTLNALGAVAALDCPGPGQISVDGSIYYKVSACAAGTIAATLVETGCNNTAGSQMWFISGCNGSILGSQCSNSGTMSNATLSMSVTAGQSFYIMVDSYAGNQCTFDMSLTGPLCLPVSLLNFSATQVNNTSIYIKWQTASEQNNARFILQRSADGNNFDHVTNIQAAGNSTSPINYSYTDNVDGTSDTYYYRLLQQNFDGKTDMVSAAVVNMKNENKGFKITSIRNENGQLEIEYFLENQSSSPIQFNIYNALGQKMTGKELTAVPEGNNKFSIDTKVLNGIYYYSFIYNGMPFNGKLFLRN